MKALIIVAQQGFQDKEYADTKASLEKAGILIHIASVQKGKAFGKFGSSITVTHSISTIEPEDYDAFVIIGGPGALTLESAHLFSLLKKANHLGKIVAAICIAPVLLAKAGLLHLKRATVWNGDGLQSVILSREGALYSVGPVISDGTIITGDGPLAATEFGKAIADALLNK